MERISKELIQKGIANGTISFSMEYDTLTVHIGDYWFYISSEIGRTQDDFSNEQLVDRIYETINDEPINDDDEEKATECLYYKAVLEESA